LIRYKFTAAAAGLAIAASIMGAGSASAATPNATAPSAAAAPKTVYYTPDVAAIAAHLPKGMHVELVPAQSANAGRPAIVQTGCQTLNWGVEVYDQVGICGAYGYTGTMTLNYYAARVYTNNNNGSMTFNKDLTQYTNYKFNQCQEFDFTVGEYNTALVNSITITGYQSGLVCSEIAQITFI
jgi:hypothetical protein